MAPKDAGSTLGASMALAADAVLPVGRSGEILPSGGQLLPATGEGPAMPPAPLQVPGIAIDLPETPENAALSPLAIAVGVELQGPLSTQAATVAVSATAESVAEIDAEIDAAAQLAGITMETDAAADESVLLSGNPAIAADLRAAMTLPSASARAESLTTLRDAANRGAIKAPATVLQAVQPSELAPAKFLTDFTPAQMAIAAQSGAEMTADPVHERVHNLAANAQSWPASALPPLGGAAATLMPVTASANGFDSGLASAAEDLQRFTPTEQRLAVPVKDARWGEAVGQRLNWLAANGAGRAEIQLDPPELGRLNVEINVRGESVQVNFQSDQGLVRDALESAMPRLREMMAQAGFGESQFDVSSQQQGAADQGQNGEGASGLEGNADGESQDGAALATAMESQIGGNGLVDYYA